MLHSHVVLFIVTLMQPSYEWLFMHMDEIRIVRLFLSSLYVAQYIRTCITKWGCKEWPSIAVRVELRLLDFFWHIASQLSFTHFLHFFLGFDHLFFYQKKLHALDSGINTIASSRSTFFNTCSLQPLQQLAWLVRAVKSRDGVCLSPQAHHSSSFSRGI